MSNRETINSWGNAFDKMNELLPSASEMAKAFTALSEITLEDYFKALDAEENAAN